MLAGRSRARLCQQHQAVPIVGGVISGGFDFAETKIIANRAYKMFIKGDLTALSDGDSTDTEIIQEV